MNIVLLAHNWDYMPLAPYKIGLLLSKRGHNVHLLLPNKKTSLKYNAKYINTSYTLYLCPTILWGGLKKGSDPLDLITRLYLLRKLEYDIILAFDSRPAVILPAVYGKLIKKIPLIIYWTDWFGRGGIIAERSGKFYKFFFEGIETFFEEYFRKYADSYAVICRPLEKRLRSLGYRKKVYSLPYGCEKRSLNGDINIDDLKKKLNLPTSYPLIGCVGSLHPKDAKFLFRSLDILGRQIEVKLILIGHNIFRNKYQIPEHIIETGRLSEMEMSLYIHACDIMVLPLRNNIANNGRWPSKLNEYLIIGKAIVSTEISVVCELLKLIKFGETARDIPEDFAEKIYGLLKDKDLLKKYGENAEKLASEYLSWPVIIKNFEGFITETLNEFVMGNKR
jgi:glycosyltransferase involved in cell wall biosynthesis